MKTKIFSMREIAEALWSLLDDIDTASDIFKPNDEKSYAAFYKYAMKKQAKRFEYLQSDGYKLFTKNEFDKIKETKTKNMGAIFLSGEEIDKLGLREG